MEDQIYVLSAIDFDGSVIGEKLYCIGVDNVRKVAEQMHYKYPRCNVFCNKAITCFGGYLITGEYIGVF